VSGACLLKELEREAGDLPVHSGAVDRRGVAADLQRGFPSGVAFGQKRVVPDGALVAGGATRSAPPTTTKTGTLTRASPALLNPPPSAGAMAKTRLIRLSL
jgi:hypothetical protein